MSQQQCEKCVYKGPVTDTGMIWCNKKNIYVNPNQIEDCSDFKEK